MPLFKPWRKLSTLPPRRGRDAEPGVYELADDKKRIIYIGQSAKDVPNRIRQHLEKNVCIQEQVVYWRSTYSRVPQSEEAQHIDKYLKRKGSLPLCNEVTPKVRSLLRRYKERSRS